MQNFILAIAIALASSACSDGDENSGSQFVTDQGEEDVDYNRFMEVASRMFDFDPSDTINYDFQPKYGEVLEPMKPTVYSIGFKSNQDAKGWFIGHCIPMDEQDSIASLSDENLTVDFGKYGSIKYTQNANSSSFGTIYLELPSVKSQKLIELIPLDLWPDNAKSLFYVGDIVYDKQTKQYFICVRACEGAIPGVLLSFSNYWNKYEYKFASYRDWANTLELPIGASEDAWDGYAKMYYENKDNFKDYIKEVKRKVKGFDMDVVPAVSYLLNDKKNDEDYCYPCGESYGNKIFGLYWEKFIYVGVNTLCLKKSRVPYFTKKKKSLIKFFKVTYPPFDGCAHSENFDNTKESENRFVGVDDTGL